MGKRSVGRVTVARIDIVQVEQGHPFEAYERQQTRSDAHPFAGYEAAEPKGIGLSWGQRLPEEPWWGKRERPLLQRDVQARLAEMDYRTSFVDHSRTTDLVVKGDGVDAVITFGFYRSDAPPSAIYITGTGAERLKRIVRGTGFVVDTKLPEARDGAAETPGACTPVIRNGKVERPPECRSTGVKLASAKDVWLITKDQYARQGRETFDVLCANLNDELVYGVVTVAIGQVSGVRVDPEDVVTAALGLRNSGAMQVWCSHPHPGEGPDPSGPDRELTKRIREAFAPMKSLAFRGHVVCTRKTYKLA